MKPFSQKKIIQIFEQKASTLFPQFSIKQIKETPTDFRAKINIENNTYLFIILVCRRPYPSEIRPLLKRAKREKGNFLFLGTYFPQGTQDFLEKEGINYLDLSGNCSISVSQLNHSARIKIAGKQNIYKSSETLKNVFSGKSSRIVRTLLELYPQKFKPLQLAKKCRVSPALVTRVIETLEQDSFVSRENEISLIDPGLLLDQWADHYRMDRNNVLFEKCYINKSIDQILESFKLDNDFVITGMAAASLLAPYSDFDSIDVYVFPNKAFNYEGLEVNRGENLRIWVPDEGVWDYAQQVEGYNTVGLIQLYLDLYSYPKRGREQAAFLRERKLKF